MSAEEKDLDALKRVKKLEGSFHKDSNTGEAVFWLMQRIILAQEKRIQELERWVKIMNTK